MIACHILDRYKDFLNPKYLSLRVRVPDDDDDWTRQSDIAQLNGSGEDKITWLRRGGIRIDIEDDFVYKVFDPRLSDCAKAQYEKESIFYKVFYSHKLALKPRFYGMLFDDYYKIGTKKGLLLSELFDKRFNKSFKKMYLSAVLDMLLKKKYLKAALDMLFKLYCVSVETSVFHGDIKPTNIIYLDKVFYLIDFGSSCDLGQDDVLKNRSLGGSLEYRDPYLMKLQDSDLLDKVAQALLKNQCYSSCLVLMEMVGEPVEKAVNVADLYKRYEAVKERSRAFYRSSLLRGCGKKKYKILHQIAFNESCIETSSVLK